MNRRMNLFRQLNGAEKKTGLPKKLPVKLTFHLVVGGGAVMLLVLGLLVNYLTYRRNVLLAEAQIKESQKAMAELAAKSEQLAVDARRLEGEQQRKPAGLDIDGIKSASSDLDGTWTSLLWKVAALTGPTIQLNRMELAGVDLGSQTEAKKQVGFDGKAKSVVAIRAWLEGMIRSIPGYVFVMDSESISTSVGTGTAVASVDEYPVTFKVTARAQ